MADQRPIIYTGQTSYGLRLCNLSEDEYAFKRSVKKHLIQMIFRNHFGPAECLKCHKMVKFSDSPLKRIEHHAIIHLFLRPYHCPICKKQFTGRFACRRHTQIKHGSSEEVLYTLSLEDEEKICWQITHCFFKPEE
jgi:hypothetical protein